MADPICDIMHESDEVFGWELVSLYLEKTYMIQHVVPNNDLRPHKLDKSCWCKPVEDAEQPDMWSHNSADHREFYEASVH